MTSKLGYQDDDDGDDESEQNGINIKVRVNRKSSSLSTLNVDSIDYAYNDVIELKDGRSGKIKFIGTLGFQSDIWYGLILSTPTGSHDGCIKNRRFWSCQSQHGTFVKHNQIRHVKLQRMGARYSIHDKVKTPKGKAYIAKRKRAGEKSSAYLSGRAVKVCKGQMKG